MVWSQSSDFQDNLIMRYGGHLNIFELLILYRGLHLEVLAGMRHVHTWARNEKVLVEF